MLLEINVFVQIMVCTYKKLQQKLHLMFNSNDYSEWFIDNTLREFEKQPAEKKNNQKPIKNFLFTLGLTYFENSSCLFTQKT